MIKSTTFLLFAIFGITFLFGKEASATAPEAWESNPLITNQKLLTQLRALRQNVRDTGCDINLCFALQGDDFITAEEFEDQKNFVDLLVAILTTDKGGNYCAVTYDRTTRKVSPLTKAKLFFLNKVRGTKQPGGFETNIAAALGYTGFQLKPRKEDANKVIILGDGLESVGFRPRQVAWVLRTRFKIDISAVAIGQYSLRSLTKITGSRKKVFRVDEFFELAEVVNGLVFDVCGFDL